MPMIAIIILVGIGLMVAERLIPSQALAKTPRWWSRVVVINLLQLAVILVAGRTWEVWFDRWSVFNLDSAWPPPVLGILAYVIVTFVFYWWHRWRHEWRWAWDHFHQIHHSPARIETITSFYKHPLEIAANSLIISLTIFFLCGFPLVVGSWLTLYTALGEFVYHMNIATPRWLGYFFQRPEMHRVHHQRGLHSYNFSDLPVWDMVFGTYRNPVRQDAPCGFRDALEAKGFWHMMVFRNVLDKN